MHRLANLEETHMVLDKLQARICCADLASPDTNRDLAKLDTPVVLHTMHPYLESIRG